jgi:hypothetical protein
MFIHQTCTRTSNMQTDFREVHMVVYTFLTVHLVATAAPQCRIFLGEFLSRSVFDFIGLLPRHFFPVSHGLPKFGERMRAGEACREARLSQ